MGEEQGLRRLAPNRERKFPNLRTAGYIVTSEETTIYNCVAWAAGDTSQQWEPGRYWPSSNAGDYLDALESAFSTLGYEVCQGDALEEGFEKVALFIDKKGEWSHAAKQTPDGQWSSKLGDWEDVKHPTPYAVSCSEYGNVARIMRRKLSDRPSATGD